jgi:hypothetical protein
LAARGPAPRAAGRPREPNAPSGGPKTVGPGYYWLNGHYVESAMNLIQSQEATCPHCWESISLTLDLSVPEQSYIEDCPVCCKPMVVSYTAADGEVAEFSVESAE